MHFNFCFYISRFNWNIKWFANVLGSSTWAEIYGVKYIGSIKALTTALMVFSTAFGTALFGILIDIGFSIENIAIISAFIYISFILTFFS